MLLLFELDSDVPGYYNATIKPSIEYLISKPATLKNRTFLKGYFIMPEARHIIGDERGNRLKMKIVTLPYF